MNQKTIMLFGNEDCALCHGWRRKLDHLGLAYTYHDTGTTDGLAEMAFRNLARIPALLIGDQRFEEVNPAQLTSDQLRALAAKDA